MKPGPCPGPLTRREFLRAGGLRTGQAVGATNSRGRFPAEKPYSPKDLLATVYRHLGIDYTRIFTDHGGRPVPILAEGRPIDELL